jgi:TRAP-type C4-dicarboxylate transport system substrate-binding protein
MKLKSILIGAVASVLAMTAGTSMAADYGKQELTVIGSWGFLDHWKEREGPFWLERVPEATGGALTANAKSLTELGASGFEVMRMLQLGAADVVFAVATYVSQDSPELEGADLPGLVSDLATYRRVIEAYRPIIERELNEKYNGKLMVIYAWPSQEMWCNLGDRSKKEVMLSELEGKKIRTYSVPLGDFIEGIGGTAVTIAFGEVVPSLQRGVADCGITGTMPAYNAKWWQVVTHNIQVKLGYAASFMAINNDTWNGLTPDAQALLLEESARLEEDFWTATANMEEVALRCNTDGPCELGPTGNMVPVVPSAEDQARVKQIFNDVVGARWAKRCGTQKCIDEWNDTIGKVAGVELSL